MFIFTKIWSIPDHCLPKFIWRVLLYVNNENANVSKQHTFFIIPEIVSLVSTDESTLCQNPI